jgi:hypothetical protein
MNTIGRRRMFGGYARIESIRRYRVPISTAPALECRQQAIGCTVPGSTCERAAQRCISVGVPRGRLPVTRPFGVRRSKQDLHTNMAHVEQREEARSHAILVSLITLLAVEEVQQQKFRSSRLRHLQTLEILITVTGKCIMLPSIALERHAIKQRKLSPKMGGSIRMHI